VRLRRTLVRIIGVIAALVAAALVALGVLLWRFDPNAYKARIEASVNDATGLALKLNGPIGFAWALRPTITLRDVVLANPPGFATPDFARVDLVSIRLDLPSLIGRRVVVNEIDIHHPVVALERARSGAANWIIARPQPPPPSPAAQPGTPTRHPAAAISVQLVRVENLDLSYRDDASGAAFAVGLRLLELKEPNEAARADLHAAGEAGGRKFDLTAQIAPLGQALAGGGPLPVTAKLRVTGADGDLTFDLSAPAENQPVRLAAAGQFRAQPVAFQAELGSPGMKLGPASPLPLKLSAQAVGSTLDANGTIGDPAKLTGVDLSVAAASEDTAKLGEWLGTALPALKQLKVGARLRDKGGLEEGVAISDLRLVSGQQDLAGTVQITFRPQPSVIADLHGARLDLSALRVAPPPRESTSSAAPPPQRPPPASVHLIPDAPLPLAALRQQNADITLHVDSVIAQDTTLHDARAEAHLHGGTLAAKIHGVYEGGAADLDVTVDARGAAPAVAIAASAPALPAGQILGALGVPDFVSGRMALAANLRGTGETPHLIAATLSGNASITMRDGRIATKVLERTLGPAVARANPLAILGKGDTTALRCLVIRAQATNGLVHLDPLLVSSELLTVSGSGTVNLASETLDLQLRPEGRAGSVSFSVPVTLSGSLRDPHAEVLRGAPVSAVLGLLKGFESGATASGPSCADALGETPSTAPPKATSAPRLPNPAGLLKQLFR